MLPALTTKPKQAVRQVKGLTNDSIDSYSNTPLGGGSAIGGGMATSYVDNTESGSATARVSPPATGRATINSPRTKLATGDEGVTMARVVRDRKASGEEELSLRTGDIVKVMSSKRTGYLKCEAGDEVGYVPSSYLEFLDSAAEAENGTSHSNGNATAEETQRAAEKQRKKQKKEKRKKEKREVNDASEPEEAAPVAPVTARSPRKEVANAEDEGNESPRRRKKKERKHRDREGGEDTHRGGVSAAEEPSSARSRPAPDDTERSRTRSKHSKKKRHRDVDSSGSSESDGGRTRSGRHGRRRRHRRGSIDSDSVSTSSDDSSGSYRRRRRRRHHRHRRSSSEEDDDDSDYKRRSRRSKKRRDKDDDDSDPEEGSRSARKAEKKKVAATLQAVEKGVSQLDIKAEEKTPEAKTTAVSSKKEEPDRDRDRGKETEHSEGSSEGRTTNVSTSRKDDEGRASTNASSSSKHNSSKSGLGRQIGEKMRSFLGGGSKKNHSSKNSSGILNACPGTVQGEEGWYEHGENERYYFVLADGKWSLLYGPMTEDDFETFSNRVLEQNRTIELPPTYLHKSGYYLNHELRVQKEQ